MVYMSDYDILCNVLENSNDVIRLNRLSCAFYVSNSEYQHPSTRSLLARLAKEVSKC